MFMFSAKTQRKNTHVITDSYSFFGVRGGAVGCSTALQAGSIPDGVIGNFR